MERDGGQAGLLGDTRQDCLGDRRSDSRLRVRKAATGHAPAIAAGLALQYVRTLEGKIETLTSLVNDLNANRQ